MCLYIMNMTTATKTRTARFLFSCSKCKKASAIEVPFVLVETRKDKFGNPVRARRFLLGESQISESSLYLTKLFQDAVPCACGKRRTCEMVSGRYSADHQCGAKCLNARRGDCECQCAGANHGRGWS